jgi:hypothetical protein
MSEVISSKDSVKAKMLAETDLLLQAISATCRTGNFLYNPDSLKLILMKERL